jgi:hypothetical protein
MNWLEKNQDTPLDELLEEDKAATIAAEALGDGQVAQSILCNDCGKKFRSKELAGFHAEKTYVTTGRTTYYGDGTYTNAPTTVVMMTLPSPLTRLHL